MNLRLSPEVEDAVRSAARRSGCSQQEVIREAIACHLGIVTKGGGRSELDGLVGISLLGGHIGLRLLGLRLLAQAMRPRRKCSDRHDGDRSVACDDTSVPCVACNHGDVPDAAGSDDGTEVRVSCRRRAAFSGRRCEVGLSGVEGTSAISGGSRTPTGRLCGPSRPRREPWSGLGCRLEQRGAFVG